MPLFTPTASAIVAAASQVNCANSSSTCVSRASMQLSNSPTVTVQSDSATTCDDTLPRKRRRPEVPRAPITM